MRHSAVKNVISGLPIDGAVTVAIMKAAGNRGRTSGPGACRLYDRLDVAAGPPKLFLDSRSRRNERHPRHHSSARRCGSCSLRSPGIINKVKAWVAGRRGPPVLQLYYDLAKLWRKGVVLSTLASPGFIAGPAVAWVALIGAAHA